MLLTAFPLLLADGVVRNLLASCLLERSRCFMYLKLEHILLSIAAVRLSANSKLSLRSKSGSRAHCLLFLDSISPPVRTEIQKQQIKSHKTHELGKTLQTRVLKLYIHLRLRDGHLAHLTHSHTGKKPRTARSVNGWW